MECLSSRSGLFPLTYPLAYGYTYRYGNRHGYFDTDGNCHRYTHLHSPTHLDANPYAGDHLKRYLGATRLL